MITYCSLVPRLQNGGLGTRLINAVAAVTKETSSTQIRTMRLLAFLLWIASVVAVSFGQQDPLTDIIEDKERIVNDLAAVALSAFRARCSQNCGDSCARSACGSPLTAGASCSDEYGAAVIQNRDFVCEKICTLRNLDFQSSFVRTAEFSENTEIVTQECWTRELENQFIQNGLVDRQGQNSLRWQYIGAPSGFYRIYPGVTQQRCFTYDPRIRPWYVAATSGPKNVILVLDVSGSMGNNDRMELTKEAALTVINTLTNSDFVAVIIFSNTAQQLRIPGQQAGTLVAASTENIAQLSPLIMSIDPYGGTNFEAAFRKAFEVLGATGEYSANCHTAILFLTDGTPTSGSIQSESGLNSLVQGLNTNPDGSLKTTMFTYTLGSGASTTIPLAIACGNRGIYAHVDDGGNLRGQMSQYYDYYATLRRAGDEGVVWVEPYIDASGAGMLVTASKAVYDSQSSPSRLIGVVAVDILVSDLEEAGEQAGIDYEGVVRHLALRNTCPNIETINITDCELNSIRSSSGGQMCGSNVCNEQNSTACPAAAQSVSYCSYQLQRYYTDPQAYQQEACCGGFAPCKLENGATLQSAHLCITLLTAILLILASHL